MIQIKKTILTLVALLAVTTGAWADDLYEEFTTNTGAAVYTGNNFKITLVDGGDGDGFYLDQQTPTRNATIEALNGETITKVEFTRGWYNINDLSCEVGTTTFSGDVATVSGVNQSSLTVSATDLLQIKAVKVYYTEGSSASGPTVAWNQASKTGTFTMPGGNVTLEPEYYPQAALTAAPTAINDVPATTDGAIVNAGTVKNIGETTTAQGTVMYYVSPSPLDDAALLALAADAWTADVPTAESLAEGQAYVYYYVRGNDSDTDDENFSDGDILAANVLTVTIAAAPTYAVTFADDLAEPDKWTASPNANVTKGETVTVTYTGTKKVIGVKAEKKAAAPAGPVTYTELKGGDVLKPGDILNFSDANVRYIFNDFNLIPLGCPFTVLRANITGDPSDPTITPADDGAYYVIQNNGGLYLFALDLSVTATSDGILITINSENGNYRFCSASVHEP